MRTISPSSKPAWDSTTPFIGGVATPRKKPTRGIRSDREPEMSATSATKSGAMGAGAGRLLTGTGPRMIRATVLVVGASFALAAPGSNSDAAEKFQKLTGTQIRTKFTG